MATDSRNSATVAAINAAISSADNLYSPPEEERRWKVYWARYWCFKSQKREKRIVPAARSEGASGSAREWPTVQAGLALAPPSSPASFVNSTVQSPASFTLSLSAVSASMCSPGRPNTMFTIGPYAHETQLVSPPVLSTFTTEPSTAPFTPPPELAHLTTPSSPDVPFAQYIKSSLEAKRATRETISPLSTSTLASPCDTPVSYTPTSSHYYLQSPVGRLISPTFGYSSGEVISYEKHSPHSSVYVGQTVSSFPTYDPYASANFDGVPFAAFILPSDTSSKCEEQPSSLLVQPESVYEHGGSSLHKEVGETIPYEHGDSSLHEEVGEKFVTEHSGSSSLKEVGETVVELQVELDLRLDQGANLGMPLEVSDNYGHTTNHDAHGIEGSCSGANANDCIKKGEKLQELLAHERNEMVLLQHPTESDGKFSAYHRDDLGETSAKGSKSSDGEPAADFEICRKGGLRCSVDPLQWVEMRPIMFKLDDIPE